MKPSLPTNTMIPSQTTDRSVLFPALWHAPYLKQEICFQSGSFAAPCYASPPLTLEATPRLANPAHPLGHIFTGGSHSPPVADSTKWGRDICYYPPVCSWNELLLIFLRAERQAGCCLVTPHWGTGTRTRTESRSKVKYHSTGKGICSINPTTSFFTLCSHKDKQLGLDKLQGMRLYFVYRHCPREYISTIKLFNISGKYLKLINNMEL